MRFPSRFLTMVPGPCCAVLLLLLAALAGAVEPGHLSVHGDELRDPAGTAIRLRGFNTLWWGPLADRDAEQIKALGANCVRYMFGYAPKGTYDPAQLATLEHNVRLFTSHGLWVIPVVHGFERKLDHQTRFPWTSPEVQREFLAMWDDILARLGGDPLIAAWEPVNEPHDGPPAAIAAWYRETVAHVRARDRLRPLVVEGADYSWPKDLGDYLLLDDPGIIYSFHFYVPFAFTHVQGDPPPAWPGSWGKDHLRQALEPVRRFRDQHHVPVLCGEWGAQTRATGYDRWLRDTSEVLEEAGLPWTQWAWMAKPGKEAADDGSFDVNRQKPGIYGVMATIFDDLGLKPAHAADPAAPRAMRGPAP